MNGGFFQLWLGRGVLTTIFCLMNPLVLGQDSSPATHDESVPAPAQTSAPTVEPPPLNDSKAPAPQSWGRRDRLAPPRLPGPSPVRPLRAMPPSENTPEEKQNADWLVQGVFQDLDTAQASRRVQEAQAIKRLEQEKLRAYNLIPLENESEAEFKARRQKLFQQIDTFQPVISFYADDSWAPHPSTLSREEDSQAIGEENPETLNNVVPTVDPGTNQSFNESLSSGFTPRPIFGPAPISPADEIHSVGYRKLSDDPYDPVFSILEHERTLARENPHGPEPPKVGESFKPLNPPLDAQPPAPVRPTTRSLPPAGLYPTVPDPMEMRRF